MDTKLSTVKDSLIGTSFIAGYFNNEINIIIINALFVYTLLYYILLWHIIVNSTL